MIDSISERQEEASVDPNTPEGRKKIEQWRINRDEMRTLLWKEAMRAEEVRYDGD